jgi:hypothetical protein
MATKKGGSTSKNTGAKTDVSAGVDVDKASLNSKFGGENPEIQVTQDAYGRWILASRTAEGNLIPRYFYVQPDGTGKDWSEATAVEIVRQYKKDYAKNAGGLEGLRKSLFDKGFLSEKEYKTRDEAAFNNRLLEAATSHSVEQVQRFTVEGKIAFTPFSSWLKGRAASGDSSGSGASQQRELTDKLNAGQDLDDFVMQMLGRKATNEEKQNYYERLNKEQKTAIRKTTVSGDVSTTTGELLGNDDRFRIMADVIAPSIKNTPMEDISKFGGRVATSIMELKETAADYGIELSSKDALDRVLRTFKTGGILDTGLLDGEKSLIREMSKAFYTKLSPLIDQGVKVSDVAKQFAKYKSQTLEVPDEAISVFDEDIQQALRNDGNEGVMTLTDYQKLLRTNPKTKPIWLKTKGAKEEASGYAYEILKSFGLMA